jgi:hypothetical protein
MAVVLTMVRMQEIISIQWEYNTDICSLTVLNTLMQEI